MLEESGGEWAIATLTIQGHRIGPRREGDPPELVADSSKLRRTLKWTPDHSQLRDIVSSAWHFERRRRLQQVG